MEYKRKLLELVEEARQREIKFIAEMGEDERKQQGTFQEWSAKDELVHIGAWKGIMCERFRAFQAEQTPPAFDDWDTVNDEIFKRHEGDSWTEAVDYLELSYQQMVEQILALSEDGLMDGQRFPWLRSASHGCEDAHCSGRRSTMAIFTRRGILPSGTASAATRNAGPG